MNYKLFLIIPPGLEDLAWHELEDKCPVENKQLLKGGIELTADLDWIVRAHLLLKIPVRMLMRLDSFKVKDFPKLHQKFLNLKWKDFLSHPVPDFEITASKSRLFHTGRIEETIKKALQEALMKQPLKQDWLKKDYPPQTFYVRLIEDELTFSLDLTGEALYKRGQHIIKGEAPLRENLAAALLLDLFQNLKTPVHLIDPMCGSGTFLTEAISFGRPLHLRPFAFEYAPFFKGKMIRLPEGKTGFPLLSCTGYEINSELVSKLKFEGVSFEQRDSLLGKIPHSSPMVMVCNPPYGERIKIAGKRGNFLKQSWEKFLTTDAPVRLGWLLPSDMDDLFQETSTYRIRSKRKFRNGGLAVTFWVWEKKS
jgi:putative N6-adenine-specific DNA methylase